MYFSCNFCGAGREYNKECPQCFSKKRPSKDNIQQGTKSKELPSSTASRKSFSDGMEQPPVDSHSVQIASEVKE